MREARISVVNSRTRLSEDTQTILARTRDRIRSVSRDRPDLILLSELFSSSPAETVPGPVSNELASLARECGTYIAFGLLRQDGNIVTNSLVLLDRRGDPVWTFDKVTPTTGEMEDGGISPGGSPRAYDCDFGRIGAAICFDVNFLELAEIYHRQEIELLLFSSAFPAGRLLDLWAIRYGFAVAGSTWYDHNRIIDCMGNTVTQTSDMLPQTTALLNLNRRVVHMDFNMEKLDRIRTKYHSDVLVEDMRDEAVCVITGLKKGLEVRDLIAEFEIETLPAYFDRARRVRRNHGGLENSYEFRDR